MNGARSQGKLEVTLLPQARGIAWRVAAHALKPRGCQKSKSDKPKRARGGPYEPTPGCMCAQSMRRFLHPAGWADMRARVPEAWRERPELEP